MRFALVDGLKSEAVSGGKGFCSHCGEEMIPKCGEKRVDHWAHKGKRVCDHWWENETEWHRSWKNHFPKDWQEQTEFDEFDEFGEKHIADIKTENGWVFEFQTLI